MDPQPTYVMIEPTGARVKVHYAWTTFFTDEKELGMTNCWIPAFDLYFCAKSKDAGNEKSKAMMKVFMSHYLDRRNGLKSLALELHKLGFRAKHDNQIMTDLVRNKAVKAKFCSAIHEIPKQFIGAERTENELELSM